MFNVVCVINVCSALIFTDDEFIIYVSVELKKLLMSKKTTNSQLNLSASLVGH